MEKSMLTKYAERLMGELMVKAGLVNVLTNIRINYKAIDDQFVEYRGVWEKGRFGTIALLVRLKKRSGKLVEFATLNRFTEEPCLIEKVDLLCKNMVECLVRDKKKYLWKE